MEDSSTFNGKIFRITSHYLYFNSLSLLPETPPTLFHPFNHYSHLDIPSLQCRTDVSLFLSATFQLWLSPQYFDTDFYFFYFSK